MRRLFILAIAVATLMTIVAGIATAAPAPKVPVCHYAAGANTFHLINISQNAFDKHIDHNDASPGDSVPGMEGYKFADDSCDMLVWTLLKTVVVPGANGNGATSVMILENRVTYELKAIGTYVYWFSQLPDAGIADAHCSLRPEGSFNAGPGPQWINGEVFGGSWTNILEVQTFVGAVVSPVDWVEPCNNAHVYTADVTGGGTTISFKILDSGYSDNSGSIAVEIWGWV